MPKIFNEHERAAIKENMLKVGAALLRKKGIRNVAVEDITKGVGISKGAFYSFYDSREDLLWKIAKMEERQLLEQMLSVASQDLDIRTKIKKIFYDVYLHEDSLAHYLPAEDMEYIKRKMPPEVIQEDTETGHRIHRSILSACNIDISEENIEISLALQQLILSAYNCETPISKTARKKVLDILIEGYADYFSGI